MLPIILAISDEGDRDFVGDIYDKYGKQMYIIAFDILKKKENAEDCVHDVFVKIIDKLDRFKNAYQDDNLIKLLVIACRNTALDKYEKNKRLASSQFSQTTFDEDGESSTIDIPDFASNVERVVMNSYTCAYVKDLINSLDYKYRDVIVLKSIGYNYDEIACIIGISQSLARKRYSRAKAMILDMGGEALYEYRE